ncbi:MAG: GNAT family N-acetyltransferase [Burkholderiales bacterium]|jgi:GNAT superfamily N-acetyltransferase|nr:GNAT family N-acetyltransferase [Burkholderiales bacterium]
MNAPLTTIRPLRSTDCLAALTALLHRAYAPLGAMGLNYTAVDQTVEVTRKRCAAGTCFVAVDSERIVGTVTVAGPHDPLRQAGWAEQTPWFCRHDAAHLHQLAVEPVLQGSGLGRRLLAQCVDWARAQGYRYLALDTAVPAAHLRRAYAKLGYIDADEVQWQGKRYRSVVMVLPLDGAPWPAPVDGVTLIRALWARMQARDWTGVRRLYADDATMLWHTSGERYGDVDAIVRVNATYPEGWTLRVADAAALTDGRVLSLVEVTLPPQRFFATSLFTLRDGLIAQVDEYWATVEPPPDWRDAATLGAYGRLPL